MSSAKLSSIARRLNLSAPEKSPPDAGLGAALEKLIDERVADALREIKPSPKVQRHIDQTNKPAPAPRTDFNEISDAVDRRVLLAFERQQRLLDEQRAADRQALEQQRQQAELEQRRMQQQLELHTRYTQRRLDDFTPGQAAAPAPVQTTPVQKPKVVRAVVERDRAGLIIGMTVNGQRLLAQRDGAGKLIGIVSEDV